MMCTTGVGFKECMEIPASISYEHIALPKNVSFADNAVTLQLFCDDRLC